MHSDEIDKLASAMVAAQGEFPNIRKTEEGKISGTSKSGSSYDYSYKYADLSTVVETVQPILLKHKLAVSQFISHSRASGEIGSDGKRSGVNTDTLTTYLLHESGQYISDSMVLHLVKDDPQGQGSAITYARRYSYMAVLGLVADVDDDGNAGTPVAVTVTRPPAPSYPKKTYPYKPKVDTVPVDVPNDIDNALDEALHDLEISITDDTAAQLLGGLKLKGFTDKNEAIAVLNEMSRLEWDQPNFQRLNNADAKVLLKRIGQPAVTKASLMTVLQPDLTNDEPFPD